MSGYYGWRDRAERRKTAALAQSEFVSLLDHKDSAAELLLRSWCRHFLKILAMLFNNRGPKQGSALNYHSASAKAA
jgi:hypothetical protein